MNEYSNKIQPVQPVEKIHHMSIYSYPVFNQKKKKRKQEEPTVCTCNCKTSIVLPYDGFVELEKII